MISFFNKKTEDVNVRFSLLVEIRQLGFPVVRCIRLSKVGLPDDSQGVRKYVCTMLFCVDSNGGSIESVTVILDEPYRKHLRYCSVTPPDATLRIVTGMYQSLP